MGFNCIMECFGCRDGGVGVGGGGGGDDYDDDVLLMYVLCV